MPKVAVAPGTPRWAELVRDVAESADPWVPGDAALEVCPQEYYQDPDRNTWAVDNFDGFAAEIGMEPDELWNRRLVSLSWPPSTPLSCKDEVLGLPRDTDTSWEAHRELWHNPKLLKHGMTKEEASTASFGEVLRLLRRVNRDLCDVSEIATGGGGFTDYENRWLRYRLHGRIQGQLGRAAASLGGLVAYRQYAAEHPWLEDMYKEEFGEAIPATDKWEIARVREAVRLGHAYAVARRHIECNGGECIN